MGNGRSGGALMLLIGAMVLWCGPAMAYVDPNASGLVFQILAPVVTLVMAGFLFVRERLARAWNAALRWAKAIL